jgi:hypothetical protein
MPITLDGTNGITTPTYGGADTSEYLVPVTQFKNRIINGAMVIDQRNAGASVTASTTTAYTLDRWGIQSSQNSKFTVQQNAGSVTPPAGFTNYAGITSSSAYSVGTSDYFQLFQVIEGFNCADLAWGTANAKTVTLSFQVRSSLTGTFGGALFGGSTFSYPFTYSIPSANTWTTISVTIAGPTSGTWNSTNGSGITVFFDLGSGSTYQGTAGAWASGVKFSATGATQVVATNGATFYITGVQLEVGSTATSFDYRPYGTELQLCMRYYYKLQLGDYGAVNGFCDNTTASIFYYQFPVVMRTSPTLGTTGSSGNYAVRLASGQAPTCNAVPAIIGVGSEGATRIQGSNSSGLTAGYGAGLIANSSTYGTFLAFSAEL